MDQGKKQSQMRDSGIFAFIAIAVIALLLLILSIVSCNTEAQTPIPEEEKVYIEMSDGNKLELVADEYNNQYLKQYTKSGVIYTPYVGETDDGSDTLRFYNAKNQ